MKIKNFAGALFMISLFLITTAASESCLYDFNMEVARAEMQLEKRRERCRTALNPTFCMMGAKAQYEHNLDIAIENWEYCEFY